MECCEIIKILHFQLLVKFTRKKKDLLTLCDFLLHTFTASHFLHVLQRGIVIYLADGGSMIDLFAITVFVTIFLFVVSFYLYYQSRHKNQVLTQYDIGYS